MKSKVFGIGFHKTGTKSLAHALQWLGYRVAGPNGVHDPNIYSRMLPMAMELALRFDAFQDNPWPVLFREMDCRFPGSKFILTTRPTDQWITSVVKHFNRESTPMREAIYGVGAPAGHERLYCEVYEQHNQAVLDYFASRPSQLLVLKITEGEGWQKLCPFLGMVIPDQPFPYENRAESRIGATPANG